MANKIPTFYTTSSEFHDASEKYWSSLSYEEKLMAFHSVCKRIHQGDIVDQGSYRHVLYKVFGFLYDAYARGMDCGYIDIHNAIVPTNTEDRQEKNIGVAYTPLEESMNRITNKYDNVFKKLSDTPEE